MTTQANERTLEQQRAAHALKKALEIKQSQDAGKDGKYRSYVDSLPAAIVMNGLGQAVATELSSKHEHAKLYANLSDWLCSKGQVYQGAEDLLEAITTHEQDHYLRAQAEALAWLTWHKKFCRAYLEGDGGQD